MPLLAVPCGFVLANLEAGQPFTVRLAMPLEGTLAIEDLVYGTVQFQYDTVDDQVRGGRSAFRLDAWHQPDMPLGPHADFAEK
jgi:hypothetical protein